MVEITAERFADLIVAEHHLKRIRKIVDERVSNYDGIKYDELKVLRSLICTDEEDG